MSEFWVLPVLFGLVLAALYTFRTAARRMRGQPTHEAVAANSTPEHPATTITGSKASIPHVTTHPNAAGVAYLAAEVVDELEDAIEDVLDEPAVSDDFYAEEEALLVEEEMQYLVDSPSAEDENDSGLA